MLRIVLPSLFVVIIAGCAAVDYIQPNSYTSYQPLENTQQYLTLFGQGTVYYRCASDNEGTFYKFENIKVDLFNRSHELIAELSGAQQSIAHSDGSSIKGLKPLKSGKTEASQKGNSLPDVLFGTIPSSASKQGVFTDAKYVTRSYTVGGLPKKLCKRNEIGKKINVPFKAKYIFWK